MSLEQKLFNLAEGLKNTTGTKAKAEYLAQHKEDKDFTKYLSILLDPLIVFGIQTKKLNKFLKLEELQNGGAILGDIKNIFDVFDYLKINNTGRDEDALLVATFIKNQLEHLQSWVSASITKTYKMGATAKSVNKAYGYNLITEFIIQRGKSYADEFHKFKNEDKMISEKFNGIRGICEVKDGKPVFKSRQNQVFEGLQDLVADMTGVKDGLYEGELIVKERHRFKLREVLQETMKILATDDTDKKLDWILFDSLTHEEFAEPDTSRTYFKRKWDLIGQQIETNNVHIAPTLYVGKDEEMIYKMLDEVVERGGEGLMANLDKPYKKDKTNHILKIKKKYTSDLRVIGFEQGKATGKHKDTLGALLLEYKGNTVKCGVMDDSTRNDVWNNQEQYLGKIVEIEHEQESGNQNNDLRSLEYPVFSMWRFDKDEPSYAHGDE